MSFSSFVGLSYIQSQGLPPTVVDQLIIIQKEAEDGFHQLKLPCHPLDLTKGRHPQRKASFILKLSKRGAGATGIKKF